VQGQTQRTSTWTNTNNNKNPNQNEREHGKNNKQYKAKRETIKDRNTTDTHDSNTFSDKKGAIENKQVFCLNKKNSNVLQMYMF